MVVVISSKPSSFRIDLRAFVSSSIFFAVSDSIFSLYSIIWFMRVVEKPCRVSNHFAQNASSLFPIVGSMSMRNPLGMTFVSRHSVRNSMCYYLSLD